MDSDKKRGRAGKRWGLRLAWLSMAVVLALVVAGAVAWHWRVGLATQAVGRVLDAHGLDGVSFRLTGLSPWWVAIENLQWKDGADTLLAVDRVELRFSLDDLRRRHVERIHVQGVRTRLLARDGQVVSPLAERMKRLTEKAQSAGPDATAPEAPTFSVWMATVRDVCIDLVSAEDGAPMAVLTLSAGGVAEGAGHYRVWGQAEAGATGAERAPLNAKGAKDALLSLKFTGSVVPETGAVAVAPVLSARDLGGCLALAQRLLPPEVLPLHETLEAQGDLTARGEFAITAWTNLAFFEVSAELGRNSRFAVPSKVMSVRFQSLRAEASGSLHEIQGRVNAGVSGFRFSEGVEASQETGRMLSLRGTACFSETATNQCVAASLETDLPGKSLATVLPRFLPLVPVFFSDGGTLRANAEVTRPLPGEWTGLVRYTAEALRSSVPMAGAYVGAQAVRVAGETAVTASKPGAVQADITLENGYYFKDGVTVKGGGEAHLVTHPPYAEAEGTFKGRVSETRLLSKLPLVLGDGSVPFEGHAVVTSLTSNPVWQIAMRLPELTVAWTQQAARVASTVGGAADVRYSATGVAGRGEIWAHDVDVSAGAQTLPDAVAGVGRMEIAFNLPEVRREGDPDVIVEMTLDVSNAWASVTGAGELREARCVLPVTWSKRAGISFRPGQSLSWQRLAAEGVLLEPDGFAWSSSNNLVVAEIGVRGTESAARVRAVARLPLAEPQKAEVTVTLPQTDIGPDDAVARLVRDKAKGSKFAGRVSADANVRFLGTRPHVTGCLRLENGRVSYGKAEVEGLTAVVPFLAGVIFRTIERPFVSFSEAKVNALRFGAGRCDFQVTRRGVFVDRLEVGWCKGSLNAYSVSWDFKAPKDDFVVYADRIDLGEALMMVMPFKGRMEGVLYGRFPVGIDNGRAKLSPGFLYSLPGQGGVLRLDDTQQMQSLLAKSGIKGDVQAPLSKALSNLDFSTLKFDLEPRQDGEGTLRIKLVGKSNDTAWPAPVDLNLNLHGPLERLVNMGLDVSRK